MTTMIPVPAWLVVVLVGLAAIWTLCDVLRIQAWRDLLQSYWRVQYGGWRM